MKEFDLMVSRDVMMLKRMWEGRRRWSCLSRRVGIEMFLNSMYVRVDEPHTFFISLKK